MQLAVVVGGHDGRQEVAAVEGYDVQQRRWRALPSLGRARRDAAVCTLRDGRLLACSGVDGEEWLRSCELYDPATHERAEIAPMPSARAASACLLGDGHVAVIGGWTDEIIEFHRREPVDPASGVGLSVWPQSAHRREYSDLKFRLAREKDDPNGLDTTISNLEGELRTLVQARRWLPKAAEDGGDGMSVMFELEEECLLSELRVVNTHNGKSDDRWCAHTTLCIPSVRTASSSRSYDACVCHVPTSDLSVCPCAWPALNRSRSSFPAMVKFGGTVSQLG